MGISGSLQWTVTDEDYISRERSGWRDTAVMDLRMITDIVRVREITEERTTGANSFSRSIYINEGHSKERVSLKELV